MLPELEKTNENFISIMKEQPGILGSWYFGSISHKMSDEYSDIDIVFLLENNVFEEISEKIKPFIASAVDKVILFWAEDFNNDKIKNFDCLLMLNGQIFQYDIFLLNKDFTEDFMCQMHYMNLQEENIIFDVQGNVKNLMNHAPLGSSWSADIRRLIETYWLHVQMSAKYFLRKDFFKLEGVLRILMDTHTSLLLTGYDTINWGGTANKLHFISPEKQKHLMKYGCNEDFQSVRDNLLQSIVWFEEDVRNIATLEEQQYNHEIGTLIKGYWIENTEAVLGKSTH